MVANYYIFKGFALKAGVQLGFMVNSEFYAHGEAKMDVFEDGVMRDVDARYQIGLTKLNKESIPGVNDSKNSVFTLTVGYKFGL